MPAADRCLLRFTRWKWARWISFGVVAILFLAGMRPAAALRIDGPASGKEEVTSKVRIRNPRVIQVLNRDWTFQYFPDPTPDQKLASPEADDSTWPAIALPHTWSIYETTHDLHPFIEHASEREDSYWWYGWGWYRKRFGLSPALSRKEVFLEFDGVQKVCFVYVNGHLAGEHKGGYTSFSIDITRWVYFGKANVIAVQVSNRRDDDLGHVPPMTAGNFDVYGGIYRSVRLVLTDKVHIPFQGSADSEGGSFITTPEVSTERATVHDTTWVRNDSESATDVELNTEVLDHSGLIVSREKNTVHLLPGELKQVDQSFQPIPNPHLWSPDTPYLYRARTLVLKKGRILDSYESTFGIRWFQWHYAESRLYLNGKPIRLIGTNRHQDFVWLGDAVPVWMQLRDLNDMRWNLGFNFQRTVHYPQTPAVYDYCDRNGILVAEEVPNIKDINFGRDVQLQNVREMIRRDRNHPSIVIWSMGNETDHPADSAWAWQEDKTRIIHLRRGTNGGDHVMTTEQDLAFEQSLRCTVRGWYNNDAHNFSPDTGEPANGQVTGTEEWQHTTDAQYLLDHSRDNIVVFLYNDHGAERNYRNSPLRNVNPKGWVDGYRFPKYVYYLWQANFTEKPMIFVHPWPWQQRYLGQKKTITIDSNCDTVELLVNGRSLGTRRSTPSNAHVVTFDDVEITDANLVAVGHKNGKTVQESLAFPGAAVKLALHLQEAHLVADRSGLAILQVDALDAANHVIPYIHPEITWSISGEGRLVGPSHYVTDTDKNASLTGEMYIALPTANIIRTTAKAGAIQVTVSSPGFKPATMTLHSHPASSDVAGIAEYPLSDEGRHPVLRDASFHAAVIRRSKPRIAALSQDYQLPASTAAEAKASMDHFLRERNPKLEPNSVVYQLLLDKLSGLLFENKGNLIADWYNFSATQFSDADELRQIIHHSPIPAEMQTTLIENYAKRIILRGETLDVEHESRFLESALANARVIQVTQSTTLQSLLRSSYPSWPALNAEEQRRAMKLVAGLNPGLKVRSDALGKTPLPVNNLFLLPNWDALRSAV